jgi:molybdate transport system substrate-binding protein
MPIPRSTLARAVAALALGAVLVAAFAGARAAADPPVLVVFAASDLTFALKELAPAFEQAMKVKVTLVFGSTGNLAKQIEHGAPADVFFAANQSFLDDLAARNAIITQTRALYAQGRIVLVTAKAAGPKLDDLRALLGERVRRVAIANPAHAPYGKAAEEALRAAGLWEALKGKLVYGENIRQALQYVETGAAEAGIVALSVADVPSVHVTPIDPALHKPLNQAAVVVRRSARPEMGVAFLSFVNGPAGRVVMKRYGFRLPGEF